MLWLASLPEKLQQRTQEAEIVETAMLDSKPFVHLAARTGRTEGRQDLRGDHQDEKSVTETTTLTLA